MEMHNHNEICRICKYADDVATDNVVRVVLF